MSENRVFRDILYDPRIFMLSYKSLFISLFSFLFFLMLLKESFGILTGAILSLFFTMGMLAFFYWKDNRDPVDYEAGKTNIKNQIHCYEPTTQKINIK